MKPHGSPQIELREYSQATAEMESQIEIAPVSAYHFTGDPSRAPDGDKHNPPENLLNHAV